MLIESADDSAALGSCQESIGRAGDEFVEGCDLVGRD
jgi:hypothetical protein